MLFSFSFQKLIVLVGIVVAVWYGFRFINRLQNDRDRKGAFDKRKEAKKAAGKRSGWRAGRKAREAIDAEEMVECSVCGAYVPARGHKNCGRSGCPY